MKKICLILLVFILVGCKNNEIIDKLPHEEEKIPTAQEVLLEQARNIYNQDDYPLTEEKVGTYFTPVRSILSSIEYSNLFDAYDKEKTGIVYEIYLKDGEVISSAQLYFVSGTKFTIYYYNDIKVGAQPYFVDSLELNTPTDN